MSDAAPVLPQELRPPCPRGCVDVEGCGCEWNQRREAWPNEPTAAINPRSRFYVRPGLSFEGRWVVIDRKIDAVVAEYESRSAARDHVKEANRG